MASFGRKKLFEILNKARDEVEAERSETSSSVSDNASELSVNPTFPRGAGRARLLRPELLSKPSTSSIGKGSASTSSVSTSPRTSTPDYENTSNVSDASSGTNALELKGKKRGTTGNSIALAVNYIPIICKPDASVFEYDVSFDPDIHSNLIRRGLLNSVLKPIVPVYTFDGSLLFLPHQLYENITKYVAKNRHDNDSPVQVTITFRRQKPMRECIQFYNILFKQVMLKLEYVQFNRKMFDPTEPMNIPHRQLTIWPGYVTACNEMDGGLMLSLDSSHRVLFDTKVLDLFRKIEMSCRQHSQNFKELALKSLLGAVVLTPYNNKTYTINDIDFEKTPMSTFKMKTGDTNYVEYYKKNYGVDIHDLKQPLLMSYKDRKTIAKNGQIEEDRLTICLIPELSQLTGLTDEMRNDKKVMRDIASYTRLTPNQRVAAARKYIERVNGTPAAHQILDNWGLRLNEDILRLDGRQLPLEKIKFGENKIISDISGDFGNHIGNNVLFEVADLNDWILMYTRQDTRTKQEFLTLFDRCAAGMGLKWNKPCEVLIPDDRNETYATELRKHLKQNTQMAVFICPTSRDDRYATIKKICCSENPVASQVINSRTLSNTQKNRSIVQKIMMQMNCKLGGSLWTIRIPFKNVMICGCDTYHSPLKKENSVAAFVASLNGTYTKWYSKATIQSNHEELLHGLSISMENALSTYKKYNGCLPDRIIMYRDGVGDSQFALCQTFEFPQLKAACRLFDENYNPNITFIIVQKRINTRIFSVDESKNNFDNPPPGTLVDHSITRRGIFDFFLVSQKMRHGTVTPSHYVVVENETNLEADILQQLSYKLTYQYFNWPGSIRVPAPCQYAHKLAYLVGESIKRETSEQLGDKLFYL